MSLAVPHPDPPPQPGERNAPRAAKGSKLLSPVLLAGYVALAVGLFAATWVDPLSRVIGGGPDPPLFIWYLRWVPFALSHGMNPLYTNYLDYPEGINLMWQTSIPLPGLLLWPVTAALGALPAYNLLMTVSVALSAWFAFLAFGRHVARPAAAALGGLLFGFSPYMLAQSLGHPHVGLTLVCPVLLMLFEETVLWQRRSPWRLGPAVGGLAGAQLLISEELLLTQVLMAALAAAILASIRPQAVRPRLPYVAKTLTAAAGVFLAVGAWPLWMQFFGPQAVHGALPAANVFVSDVLGFVMPTSLQAIAPTTVTSISDRFSGSQYEAGAYLGVPLLVVLVVGAFRYRRLPVVKVASMLLLLAAALSLGVTFHLAGRATAVPAGLLALAFIPLVRTKAGRLMPVLFALVWLGLAVAPILDDVVPGRLVLYVFLFAGLLLAVCADRVAALGGGPRWLAAVAASLVVLMLMPRLPFPSAPADVPPFFTLGGPTTNTLALPPGRDALAPGRVILVVPYARDFESRAMLWQAMSGMRFRMPEGYANRPGPSLDPPPSLLGSTLAAIQQGAAAPPVTAPYRKLALDELRRWQVAAIVLGQMEGQERALAFLSAVIDAAPVEVGNVYVWRVGSL